MEAMIIILLNLNLIALSFPFIGLFLLRRDMKAYFAPIHQSPIVEPTPKESQSAQQSRAFAKRKPIIIDDFRAVQLEREHQNSRERNPN